MDFSRLSTMINRPDLLVQRLPLTDDLAWVFIGYAKPYDVSVLSMVQEQQPEWGRLLDTFVQGIAQKYQSRRLLFALTDTLYTSQGGLLFLQHESTLAPLGLLNVTRVRETLPSSTISFVRLYRLINLATQVQELQPELWRQFEPFYPAWGSPFKVLLILSVMQWRNHDPTLQYVAIKNEERTVSCPDLGAAARACDLIPLLTHSTTPRKVLNALSRRKAGLCEQQGTMSNMVWASAEMWQQLQEVVQSITRPEAMRDTLLQSPLARQDQLFLLEDVLAHQTEDEAARWTRTGWVLDLVRQGQFKPSDCSELAGFRHVFVREVLLLVGGVKPEQAGQYIDLLQHMQRRATSRARLVMDAEE